MNCQDAKLLIEVCQPDEPDLGGPEFGGLREHVAQCPQCASALEETKAFDEKLSRAFRHVPMPAGLEQRIMTQLAAVESKPRGFRGRWRWAAAAVAAAVLVGAYAMWPAPSPRWTLEQAVDVIAGLRTDPEEKALPEKRPLPGQLPRPQSYQYVRRALAGHSVDVLQCWFGLRGTTPSAEVYIIPNDWLVGPIGNAPAFVYFYDSEAGLSVMAWREGERTFLLVSHLTETELQQWFGDTAQWT